MSSCTCNKCGELPVRPSFEVVDWADEGFIARCPQCKSTVKTFTVSGSEINSLPDSIAGQMLAAMHC